MTDPIESGDVRPTDSSVSDDPSELEFVHTHLPKLDNLGIIVWDRDAGTITRGPLWDDVEPLIELIRDKEELERQNKRLDEFTRIVSHDLKNPLHSLTLALDQAEMTGDPEDFERCWRAIDRMDELIDDLLKLARHGETVVEPEAVDLSSMSITAWESIDIERATLEIETDTAILADANRLEELLVNLFENAIIHGGKDVTVGVGDLPEGFYVEDDGPGIPADSRDDVFNAGYTTTDGGTGFGLSIVSTIAEAHGWEVSVTDSLSGGARFEITEVEFS